MSRSEQSESTSETDKPLHASSAELLIKRMHPVDDVFDDVMERTHSG